MQQKSNETNRFPVFCHGWVESNEFRYSFKSGAQSNAGIRKWATSLVLFEADMHVWSPQSEPCDLVSSMNSRCTAHLCHKFNTLQNRL